MYIRFAAVEIVSPQFKEIAITLVLSGGCIAAFLGPETALGTRDVFGDNLTYFGAYLMAGVFNILQAISIVLVKFPSSPTQKIQEPNHKHKHKQQDGVQGSHSDDDNNNSNNNATSTETKVPLTTICQKRTFWIPLVFATSAWVLMALLMSVFRIVMTQLGFSPRQSLLVIELHFLGMFLPGFFTGKLIARSGCLIVVCASVFFFAITVLRGFLANADSAVFWILSQICFGVG